MTGSRQSWTWRIVQGDGESDRQPAPDAASRFDAEMWLGEHWRSLAEAGGVQAVLLLDGVPQAVVELREG